MNNKDGLKPAHDKSYRIGVMMGQAIHPVLVMEVLKLCNERLDKGASKEAVIDSLQRARALVDKDIYFD